MVDRIQITKTCYMKVDGQYQIVDGGVIDVADAKTYKGVSAPVAETPAALASHGGPTSIRNLRTR